MVKEVGVPLDPTEEPPKDLFNDAHRAIIASAAPGISITGNVVRGGALATWPHAGGIVVSDCEGFTFTENAIGDGNQGRGILIDKSSGTVKVSVPKRNYLLLQFIN